MSLGTKATYKFDQVTLAREQATATTIVDAQTGHKNSDASQFFSPMPFTSNEAQGGGYRIYRAKIGLQAQQFVFAIAISSQPSRFRLLGRFSHTSYGSLVRGRENTR